MPVLTTQTATGMIMCRIPIHFLHRESTIRKSIFGHTFETLHYIRLTFLLSLSDGRTVAVKHIQKRNFTLSKTIRKEVKEVR